MRTARPPLLQNPSRSAHGRLRIHRGLVQPPSPPCRPRLSVTDQLRKGSANRKPDRKPNTVHRSGVAPPAHPHSLLTPRPPKNLHHNPVRNDPFSAPLYVDNLVEESELVGRQTGAPLGERSRLAARVAASPIALSPNGCKGKKSRIARRGKPR